MKKENVTTKVVIKEKGKDGKPTGKNDTDITTAMKNWKPEVSKARGDGMEAMRKKLAKLSPDQRKALLAG